LSTSSTVVHLFLVVVFAFYCLFLGLCLALVGNNFSDLGLAAEDTVTCYSKKKKKKGKKEKPLFLGMQLGFLQKQVGFCIHCD